MAGPRCWLSALFVAGASGIVVAEEPTPPRPRILVGTKLVVEEPALPTYLTIMPRVVEEAPAPLPATIDEAIPAAYVAAAAKSADSLPPAAIPDSVHESHAAPTYIVMPASAASPPDEVGTAMLRQTVAVLGAIVVALFVVVACVLFVRRRAPALFQVQVVGGSPATAEHLPMALSVTNRSNYVTPETNFVLGPTFAEEASEREAAAERQSRAVFSQIAADNLVLRAELSRHLPVTAPAV
jgi:hypothetical protein